MIKFSVIICTYNRSEYLLRVLNKLNNQTFSNPEFEVIVVNNNSPDSTEIVCMDFKKMNPDLNFVYYFEERKGLSFARNSGIEISQGEFVIFLDDDAEPIYEYLENINAFLNNYPDCIAAGGRIFPNYETNSPAWMSDFLLPLVSAIDLGNNPKKFSGYKYPIGANMIFKRSIFNKIGNFNTQLGRIGDRLLGGEEKEIFMKLANVTNQIYYIPNAIVYHFIPEKRIQLDYIRNMAIEIGISNRLIFDKSERVGLYFREIIKWGGSVFLFIVYLFKLTPTKGIMIIKFRYWVSKGIFKI